MSETTLKDASMSPVCPPPRASDACLPISGATCPRGNVSAYVARNPDADAGADGLRCDDGWWRSPACRRTSACVPVVLRAARCAAYLPELLALVADYDWPVLVGVLQ